MIDRNQPTTMDVYESVALVKPEVFVYRIPPLTTNRGHRAADWKLDAPDWVGRLRLVALGHKLEVRLEDKASGQLFAKCPVDMYPGAAIETVTDSSRYFVARLQDDNGRTAFIGLGFADRGDSFDLNVALQDHFKYLEKSSELEKQEQASIDKPKLDLGFKDGQTITINLGGKKGGQQRPRPSASGGGPIPLLPPPPPPGSSVTAGSASPRLRPPASSSGFATAASTDSTNNVPSLLDF